MNICGEQQEHWTKDGGVLLLCDVSDRVKREVTFVVQWIIGMLQAFISIRTIRHARLVRSGVELSASTPYSVPTLKKAFHSQSVFW